MPIIKSAIKRMRQTFKRRARNITAKRSMRVAVKAFDAAKDNQTLSQAHSQLDTAVKKRLLSKNAAARKKAQLARTAKAAGVKVTGKATETKSATTKKVTSRSTTKRPAAEKAV